jgi:hypothetical protein
MDELLAGKGEMSVRARKLGRWFIGLVALLAAAGAYGVKSRATARTAQAERATANAVAPRGVDPQAVSAWLSRSRPAPAPQATQEAPATTATGDPTPRLDAEAPYRQLPLEALHVALGRAPTREEQDQILAARHRLASDNALAYLRLQEGELDWDAYAAMLADHDQEFQHSLERLLHLPGDELRALTGL